MWTQIIFDVIWTSSEPNSCWDELDANLKKRFHLRRHAWFKKQVGSPSPNLVIIVADTGGEGKHSKSLFVVETDDLEDAIARTAAMCPLVVCTRSGDGVTILSEGQRHDIPVEKIKPVDATGAGDQFAAGFLYGLANGHDLETSGRMGCVAAREVIGHVGPRPENDVETLFRAAGLLG